MRAFQRSSPGVKYLLHAPPEIGGGSNRLPLPLHWFVHFSFQQHARYGRDGGYLSVLPFACHLIYGVPAPGLRAIECSKVYAHGYALSTGFADDRVDLTALEGGDHLAIMLRTSFSTPMNTRGTHNKLLLLSRIAAAFDRHTIGRSRYQQLKRLNHLNLDEDLNLLWPSSSPSKADRPLVVDTDTRRSPCSA